MESCLLYWVWQIYYAFFLYGKPGWNWKKLKEKLSNTLRLNFNYLKIIRFFSFTLPSMNKIRHSKKCTKNKYVCFNDVTWFMIMKNRSQSYKINCPMPRHGYQYTKYKMCLSIIMVICIKQHLSNIWSSIHGKVK